MQPVSSTSRFLAAAIAAALLPAVVQADPTSAELLQKIEELSQKVLVLERKLEVQDEATKTAATTAPVVKASPRGFSIASADSKNQLKLRGVVHVDGRFFGSDDPEGLKDTWQATRVRPIVEGTLGGIYDFRITPDFGQGRTVIQDAYVTARFKPQCRSRPASSRRRSASSASSLRATSAWSRAASRRSSLPTATSGCRWPAVSAAIASATPSPT